MKTASRVPEGIAIPNCLEPRIGILTVIDDVPAFSTAQLVSDNLNFRWALSA